MPRKIVLHTPYNEPEYDNDDYSGFKLGFEIFIILVVSTIVYGGLMYIWHSLLEIDASKLETKAAASVAEHGVTVSPNFISVLFWIFVAFGVIYLAGKFVFWLDIFEEDKVEMYEERPQWPPQGPYDGGF